MARCALAHRGDPGSLCRLKSGGAGRRAHGLAPKAPARGRRLSLAVAIWSMHFVGMLATRLPFPVDYLVFPTLLSFLVCVLVVGAAVFAVSAGPPTRRPACHGRRPRWALESSSMHYVGMSALHASAHLHARAFSSSLRASSSRSPPPVLRFGSPADVAVARRCCSRRSRSVSRSPACTTPRWPA